MLDKDTKICYTLITKLRNKSSTKLNKRKGENKMARVVETEVLRNEENYYEGYMVAVDAPDYETAKRIAYVNYDCFKRTELPAILEEDRERRIEEIERTMEDDYFEEDEWDEWDEIEDELKNSIFMR